MRDAIIRFGTFVLFTVSTLLALSVAVAGANGGSEDKRPSSDKSSPPTVEESFTKLKGGILKLKEAEILALLGPPDHVKHPGMPGFDLQMQWRYSTHIYGTFKAGKLVEVTAAFSERLPVERITFANFKRLRVGMTEGDVVEILGKSNGTTPVESIVIHSWGNAAQLQVSLSKDGQLVKYGLNHNSAVFFPAGFAIPGLPK